MSTLSGITASTPFLYPGISAAANPGEALLAAEAGLTPAGLPGNTSTIVELSGESQLLFAVAAFQDQLQSLQPGTASSGQSGNSTDLASFAAEAQSFVDAFNGLQNTLAGISSTSTLLGGSVPDASNLSQSLNALARADFTNGNSGLTELSQLGIEFQPSPLPGQQGRLSLNLGTLQAAFNADAKGAFSLLATVVNSLGEMAGSLANQAGRQLSSLATLAQVTADSSLLSDSLLFQNASSVNGLGSTLALDALTGNTNLQQVASAINEYTLISGLLL
jgi:hypothetical protein